MRCGRLPALFYFAFFRVAGTLDSYFQIHSKPQSRGRGDDPPARRALPHLQVRKRAGSRPAERPQHRKPRQGNVQLLHRGRDLPCADHASLRRKDEINPIRGGAAVQRIAIWLTEYFIRKGIVPEAEREVYEYGFAITICTIASTLGLLLGQFLGDLHLLHLSVLRRGVPRLHAPALLPDDVRRAPGRARLLAPPLPLWALAVLAVPLPCIPTSSICWRTRRR